MFVIVGWLCHPGLRVWRLRFSRRQHYGDSARVAVRTDYDWRRNSWRLLANNMSIKATIAGLGLCFKGNKLPKTTYMELMALLFDILQRRKKA